METQKLLDIILELIHETGGDRAWAKGKIKGRLNIILDNLSDLTCALYDNDPFVRYIVVLSLGALDDTQVVPFLLKALADIDPSVREEAAYSLRRWNEMNTGISTIVPALILALHDPRSDVRFAAAYALGVQHDLRAVEPLIDKLSDKSGKVRFRAGVSLEEITGKSFFLGIGMRNPKKWRIWWEANKSKKMEK